MSLRELATYSFACNVGATDRAIRIILGLGLILAAVVVIDGLQLRIGAAVGGAALALTGVVSRCGMYYLLGRSTARRPEVRAIRK